MTIQRQYVLPNCSLILDGLSTDTSSVLSILANAEFKIVGLEQPLAGGLEFFKAIVGAVNAYCQHLLSGLEHPDHMASQSSLVSVEPAEGQYHRLLVQPELLNAEEQERQPRTITLSTVQLFDMAEAIDQFFADGQTLPEFSVPLAPLARRHVRSQEPLVQRALSPALGVATLAAAGLGLFFMPVPDFSEEQLTPPAALEETTDTPLASPPPDGVSEGATPNGTTATAEEPNEPEPLPPNAEQLSDLQQQVQQQISAALPADAAFAQPLSYEISVAKNGDIVGYNPADTTAVTNLESTPLPQLTYIPLDDTTVNPVAQFDVIFGTDGSVAVGPAGSATVVTPETVTPETVTPETVTPEITPETTPAAETTSGQDSDATATPSVARGELSDFVDNSIQDPNVIVEINQELRRTIISNMASDWSAPADLRYRIRLDQSGQVVGYEADNQEAARQADALKIPNLVKAADGSQPQLDFLVFISGNNVVEVNPWNGWPE